MPFARLYQNKERIFTGVGIFATIYGGVILWKDYLIGKRYRIITDSIPSEDLVEAKRKKVFLVTGANSGMCDKKNNTFRTPILASCRRLQNQFNLIFTIILIGLGKEVTKELAKLETSKVYMLCRNMEKCEMTRRNIVTETKNK